MPVTKIKVPRNDCYLKRSVKLISIIIYGSPTVDWHAATIELKPSHCVNKIEVNIQLTIAIRVVFIFERRRIDCEYRFFARITAVEQLNSQGIPILCKYMVTIELQLVSLAIIVPLDHFTGIVDIFGVHMPYILHEDSRRVL